MVEQLDEACRRQPGLFAAPLPILDRGGVEFEQEP
jgi:hypothetical protein